MVCQSYPFYHESHDTCHLLEALAQEGIKQFSFFIKKSF